MTGAPTRVFVARLAGRPLFDPMGDQVGRVRDVVVALRASGEEPRVLGLVVEVPGRRRIFVPMTRVTSIDAGQVITTGLVNMRRFQQRPTETLVLGEMLDRTVTLLEDSSTAVVEDVGMEQQRTRDWVVTRVFVRRPGKGLRRRGEAITLEWRDVSGFSVDEDGQGAANLLATFEKLNAADLATVLHELSPKRRAEVAAALDDETLADVLEELPEDDQVEILGKLEEERAADVLEAMQPDDAADLLSELPHDDAEKLLELDGARRGRSAAPPARLLRRHGRRHDDHRAGHPAAGRHRRRGARAGPPARALPGARRAGLRLPAAARDADRSLHRHRAHPAAAARAPVGARQRRGRHRHRAAPARRAARRDHAPPGDVQPGGGARSSTRTTTCWARSPSTTSSTTCSPTTGAPGTGQRWPPARSRRWSMARETRRSSATRLDQPREVRRSLVPTPTYDPEAFGRLSERIARFIGTGRFLVYMTVFVVVWVVWNVVAETLIFDDYPFIFLTLMLSLQASYAAPLILLAQNRQADRDRVQYEQDRARTERTIADTDYLTRELASLADRGRRRGHPRLPALRAAPAARGARRAPGQRRRHRDGGRLALKFGQPPPDA